MKRREFLVSVSLLAFAVSQALRAGPKKKLNRIDPRCPPGAFDEVMTNLRKMREAGSEPLSEAEKLQNGRAWLAGTEVTDLKPGERSYWLSLPRSDVKVRVLQPAGVPKGAILAIHGGAWALGTALSDEKRNWQLARRTRSIVVSPDYRLAPEHPYPAGPDDCERAARWLLTNPLGTSNLAITGGSAGAHLAALTLCRLSEEDRSRFKRAVLFYGVYDLGRSQVWREAEDEDFPDLSPDDMNIFLEYFLPGKTDEERRAPQYSPLHADLKKMPPALFLVGTADLLADDSRRLAERWAECGNEATLVEYPGGPHGFNGFGVDCGLDPEQLMADFILEGY